MTRYIETVTPAGQPMAVIWNCAGTRAACYETEAARAADVAAAASGVADGLALGIGLLLVAGAVWLALQGRSGVIHGKAA